ncbi:hypothetical protein BaRGS_00013779 [Batillaria attramentaria]|uniref:Uncharacterized protein n=1 Tax=Batillaria attramentaria TaxID=370345 RepID=A0ABD0L6E9_9CAEN
MRGLNSLGGFRSNGIAISASFIRCLPVFRGPDAVSCGAVHLRSGVREEAFNTFSTGSDDWQLHCRLPVTSRARVGPRLFRRRFSSVTDSVIHPGCLIICYYIKLPLPWCKSVGGFAKSIESRALLVYQARTYV